MKKPTLARSALPSFRLSCCCERVHRISARVRDGVGQRLGVAPRFPVMVDADLATYAVVIIGECRRNRAERDGRRSKGEDGLFHDVPLCSGWTDVNRGGSLSLHGLDLISCSHRTDVLGCVSRAPSRHPFESRCIS